MWCKKKIEQQLGSEKKRYIIKKISYLGYKEKNAVQVK